ncbi:hypothetical protein ACIP2X_02405 [Streptomyces sp. NPDC089424]|uniref:hypothetical protein n=1 Tax=Streptomyces sp. NPDC089424 TaxID=3365917 RepID=UPI003815A421
MHDPRTPARRAPRALKDLLPPPALGGFLLLLALVFVVAYAVGSAVGPVAPGMHRPDGGATGTDPRTGTHGDHTEGHTP